MGDVGPIETKMELILALKEIVENSGDIEADHCKADDLLLAYINDPEVTAAFEAIDKWYA